MLMPGGKCQGLRAVWCLSAQKEALSGRLFLVPWSGWWCKSVRMTQAPSLLDTDRCILAHAVVKLPQCILSNFKSLRFLILYLLASNTYIFTTQ